MDEYFNWGLLSNNPLLSSFNLDNSATGACVDPNEACGHTPVTLPIEDMATGRITLRKFSGYPTEEPERFVSDFNAYCVFNRITDDDPRRVAAFQLHLEGPAQTWFTCLDEEDKSCWETILGYFNAKYSSTDNKPVLLVETEQFLNIRLQPTQQIEDYFSKVVEKGRKLSKQPQEVLLKFIQGLPSQLAFFVRAGNPDDVHGALTSAKMGEAYGYRNSPAQGNPVPGVVAAAAPSGRKDADKIHSLEISVQDLTHKLDKLLNTGATSSNSRVRADHQSRGVNSRVCYGCNAPGHVKRQCNLAGGSPDHSAQCQICSQFGHVAKNCKLFMDGKHASSGNLNYPRNAGRGPLGGQY